MSHRSADLCNVQNALALQVEHQNNTFILKKKSLLLGCLCGQSPMYPIMEVLITILLFEGISS